MNTPNKSDEYTVAHVCAPQADGYTLVRVYGGAGPYRDHHMTRLGCANALAATLQRGDVVRVENDRVVEKVALSSDRLILDKPIIVGTDGEEYYKIA